MLKGLIIKAPWIDYILSGQKTWEIRGSNTKTRGTIYLIKSGSGKVYGSADIVDCIELSLEQYQKTSCFHKIPVESLKELPYKRTYAWVIRNAKYFAKPVDYVHPRGAVIWVNI